MRAVKIQPKNVEAKFNVDEIFFSSTDLKGIILSGNRVFFDVAKYEPEELIGSPHNIVRHPDMPKTIFKLLWDYIKGKKPIVAYVKNLAKDGSFYWVVALVLPIIGKDGKIKKYLSIRVKPTSKYFEIIPALYKKLKEVENKYGVDDAISYLSEELEKLGFDSYDDFMYSVLREEILSKADVLKVKSIDIYPKDEFSRAIYAIFKFAKDIDNIYDEIYSKIGKLEEFGKILKEKSEYIFNLTDNIRLISLNSSVESFKLGSDGASFSVLSAEMRKNSEVGNKIIEEMKNTTDEISIVLRNIVDSISISKLEIIAITQFLNEIINYGKDEHSGQSLCDLMYLLDKNSQEDMNLSYELNKLLQDINENIKKLKILIKRLEFLYLNGMVESAHQTETSFSIIFTEVNKLVESTRSIVTEINNPLLEVIDENKKIFANIQKVSTDLDKIKKHLSAVNASCQTY